MLLFSISEEEGQAMLKNRDEADYKALAAIGLFEPEDSEKALGFGFPNRNVGVLKDYEDLLANNESIPMPLAAILPTELPPALYMDGPGMSCSILVPSVNGIGKVGLMVNWWM